MSKFILYVSAAYLSNSFAQITSNPASLNPVSIPPTPTTSQPQETAGVEKEYESPVCLSKERGFRIDLIRVINVLYLLGFFTGKDGRRITKKEVFSAIGKAVNADFSSYDVDLSRSLSDSTKLQRHLSIFDRMKEKMEEVFNNFG